MCSPLNTTIYIKFGIILSKLSNVLIAFLIFISYTKVPSSLWRWFMATRYKHHACPVVWTRTKLDGLSIYFNVHEALNAVGFYVCQTGFPVTNSNNSKSGKHHNNGHCKKEMGMAVEVQPHLLRGYGHACSHKMRLVAIHVKDNNKEDDPVFANMQVAWMWPSKRTTRWWRWNFARCGYYCRLLWENGNQWPS